MKINNNIISPQFTGAIDFPLTRVLALIDTNPMASATLVDTSAMVLPRTYIDKKRNKFAKAETFFREATGTVIVCLSGGILAKGISALYNKIFDKKINIKSNIWATNESFKIMKEIWGNSKTSKDYVNNILNEISGIDGNKNVKFSNINFDNVNWIEIKKFKKIHWNNKKYQNLEEKLKTKEDISKAIIEVIENKNLSSKDSKNIVKIINFRIANALGADTSVKIKDANSSLNNIIRDSISLAKNIFIKNIDLERASKKIAHMNRTKTIGAVLIASMAGLFDQYINRLITEKRRGKDEFVGTIGQNISQSKVSKKNLNIKKIVASLGIIFLALKVMKVKSASDFIKKLEFTSIATSGNVIKTIYTSLLVGRFIASRNNDELRESVTRDYFGFINWLVAGNFVAKGVAKIFFDKKANNIFNNPKLLKNPSFKDITLKSHMEIASRGKSFADKNIWKLNIAHLSGLLYSGLALGFAIPILNIFVTNRKNKIETQKKA